MKNLTLKHKIIVSLSFTVLTVLLFSIVIFGIRKQAFSSSLLLNYTLLGLILSIYTFILLFYRFIYALCLFIIAYILAFINLYITLISINEGFSDLAGILSWFIILIAGIIIGILVESILKLKKTRKTELSEFDEEKNHEQD